LGRAERLEPSTAITLPPTATLCEGSCMPVLILTGAFQDNSNTCMKGKTGLQAFCDDVAGFWSDRSQALWQCEGQVGGISEHRTHRGTLDKIFLSLRGSLKRIARCCCHSRAPLPGR
jgi:hypothetical protein